MQDNNSILLPEKCMNCMCSDLLPPPAHPLEVGKAALSSKLIHRSMLGTAYPAKVTYPLQYASRLKTRPKDRTLLLSHLKILTIADSLWGHKPWLCDTHWTVMKAVTGSLQDAKYRLGDEWASLIYWSKTKIHFRSLDWLFCKLLPNLYKCSHFQLGSLSFKSYFIEILYLRQRRIQFCHRLLISLKNTIKIF